MSIRLRITVLATVLAAVVLLASSAAIISVQRQQLTDNLDKSLGQRADQISALLSEGRAVGALGEGLDTERFAQVVVDGEVVAATGNVANFAPFVSSEGIDTVDDLPIEDDAFRLLSVAASVEGSEGLIIVAENTDDIDDALGALIIAMLAIVPLATLLLGVVTWWLVGRTLRPVEAIRAAVAGIGANELGRRVSVPDVRDEIHHLASTMNSMLARLEDASIRQRQFISDASHELRSPLTRMRTELEVELRREHDGDFETAARSALTEVVAMQGLVDDLLSLARQDAGSDRTAFGPVDPGLLARELEALAPEIRVEVDGPSALVHGDSGQLRRLLRNLVENALRHCRDLVRIRVHVQESDVHVVVDDDGEGISESERAVVFDRFNRSDEARSVERGGAGLGLAIARGIVDRHGGTISVEDSDLGGARLRVVLPRADGQVMSGAPPNDVDGDMAATVGEPENR